MFINKRIKDLSYFAKINSSQYILSKPFSHIIFNNFFNDDFLSSVLDEFPIFEDSDNKQKIYNLNENKIVSKGEKSFKKNTKLFFHCLNSEPFLNFLQILTSIQETLIPDPYFSGGGFHESKKNGFLNIHADFNKHYLTNLDRRLTILPHLSPNAGLAIYSNIFFSSTSYMLSSTVPLHLILHTMFCYSHKMLPFLIHSIILFPMLQSLILKLLYLINPY